MFTCCVHTTIMSTAWPCQGSGNLAFVRLESSIRHRFIRRDAYPTRPPKSPLWSVFRRYLSAATATRSPGRPSYQSARIVGRPVYHKSAVRKGNTGGPRVIRVPTVSPGSHHRFLSSTPISLQLVFREPITIRRQKLAGGVPQPPISPSVLSPCHSVCWMCKGAGGWKCTWHFESKKHWNFSKSDTSTDKREERIEWRYYIFIMNV